MKKPSRSLLPQKHISTNNVDRVYNAISNKSDLDDSEKLTLEHITQIIDAYKNVQEDTLTRRNNYLVNFIIDNLQDKLKPYIDNYSTVVGLDQMISEALSDDDVSNKIKKEILRCLKAAIKKIQVQNKKQKTTKKTTVIKKEISSEDTKKQSKPQKTVDENDNKDIQKKIETELEQIFEKIKKNKNDDKNIKIQHKKHTKDIIDLYRKRCGEFAEKIKSTKDSGRPQISKDEKERINKTLNVILKNRFKKIELVKKKGNIFLIFNVIFSRFGKFVTKIFGPVWKAFKLIFGVLTFPFKVVIKYMIKPLLSGLFLIGKGLFKGVQLLGKGLVKTLKLFRVDKLFVGVIKELRNAVKFAAMAVKNTFLAFMCTPTGMYAIGYMLGYIYGKVRRKLFGGNIMPEIGNTARGTFNTIKIFMNSMFDSISEFYYGFLNDFIHPIVYTFKPIWNAGKDIFESVMAFVMDNPKLSAFILGFCMTLGKLIQIAGPAAKMVKAVAGGPLNMLIALGIVAIAKGIPYIFDRFLEKNRSFRVSGKQMGDYQNLHDREHKNEIFIKGLTAQEKQDYDEFSQILIDESLELNQLMGDTKTLVEIWNKDTGGDKYKHDLNVLYPDFVQSVFDSKITGFNRRKYIDFQVDNQGKTTEDQLTALNDYLNLRYEKLIVLKSALVNIGSTRELSKTLKNIMTRENETVKVSKNATELMEDVEAGDHNKNYNLGYQGHINVVDSYLIPKIQGKDVSATYHGGKDVTAGRYATKEQVDIQSFGDMKKYTAEVASHSSISAGGYGPRTAESEYKIELKADSGNSFGVIPKFVNDNIKDEAQRIKLQNYFNSLDKQQYSQFYQTFRNLKVDQRQRRLKEILEYVDAEAKKREMESEKKHEEKIQAEQKKLNEETEELIRLNQILKNQINELEGKAK